MNKLFIILIFISFYGLSFAQKSHSDIIDVQEYTIVLDISDIDNAFIKGYTTVSLKPVQENIDVFHLDLLALEIDSITCDQSELDEYIYNDTLIIIDLVDSFGTTDIIDINVYYHGNPVMDPSGWGGFYFMSGYAFNLGVGFDDLPHNYGRVWFPCNDDFIDRAKYNTIITTQDVHTAVCGGELVNETINAGDNTKTYEWVLNEEIPTYLASVSVGPYFHLNHTYEGIEADIPVDYYVYPSDSAKAADSFVNMDTVLSIFETQYGPYRWNRVGFVAVPFNSGAMEHATNIAMGRGFINGDLTYEDLFYHELSHHWFGDLITCSSAEDMWINEGWAVYSETLYREFLYGKPNSLAYRRAAHETVLRYYHIQDGGFLPLYPMPQDRTYSRTVYEKGASVVQGLRGYLGDDLFFATVKEYLNQNEYASLSSYDMRDLFTSETGIDMTDFFDAWVFGPGFMHFSIDSTQIVEAGADYDVTVFMHQKLRGRTEYANSNRVEISFIDENYVANTQVLEFDGEFGEQTFTVPFNPILVLCDYNEVVSDATVDQTKRIGSTGTSYYSYTYVRANILSVNETDSAMLRITHNWVAPDTFKNVIPGLIIADHRFWTIEGVFPENFKANAMFSYNTSTTSGSLGYLDNSFISNSMDSLVLLYRPNKAVDWTIEETTNSTMMKRLSVDSLKLGEYSLAIYDWDRYLDIQNANIIASTINIYPNPSSGQITISTENDFSGNIQIFNSSGILVYQQLINSYGNNHEINIEGFPEGLYIMQLHNEKTNKRTVKKIIIQK